MSWAFLVSLSLPPPAWRLLKGKGWASHLSGYSPATAWAVLDARVQGCSLRGCWPRCAYQVLTSEVGEGTKPFPRPRRANLVAFQSLLQKWRYPSIRFTSRLMSRPGCR